MPQIKTGQISSKLFSPEGTKLAEWVPQTFKGHLKSWQLLSEKAVHMDIFWMKLYFSPLMGK